MPTACPRPTLITAETGRGASLIGFDLMNLASSDNAGKDGERADGDDQEKEERLRRLPRRRARDHRVAPDEYSPAQPVHLTLKVTGVEPLASPEAEAFDFSVRSPRRLSLASPNRV